MHFFHPIQQCAQQIYHTALPLSPTSSQLRNSHLQSVTDDHLSRVVAFSGAPDAWGLLLRTIDVRPRQLTCIATSAQSIVTACEDIVDIYNAVTFVLRQSLRAPETVAKIQGSPDGSTLFFAHSYSVTVWDVQTGGIVHAFTTQSYIIDMAVSTTGDHIACGSPDGSVAFWNTHTNEEGEGFGNGQPVVTICWLSSQELAVATRDSYLHLDMSLPVKPLTKISTSGHVWGMLYPEDGRGLVVGTSQPCEGVGQELCSLETMERQEGIPWRFPQKEALSGWPLRMHPELLPLRPTLVGEEIACITPPSGVQSFNTRSREWTHYPPLLGAATSVAVSLNRYLVAQTKDSIQIFSIDVLRNDVIRDHGRPSHVYPAGRKTHPLPLQQTRHLTLLELETLRKLRS
jgi:WD40 repeat protein